MLQRKAIEETQAIFPSLRQRIMATSAQLDELLVRLSCAHIADQFPTNRPPQASEGQDFPEAEVSKAKEALATAKSLG